MGCHPLRPASPDHLDFADLAQLAEADTFRFANRVSGWVDVEDGRVVDAGWGQDSEGLMGGSSLRVGPWETRVAAVAFPDRRQPVERSEQRARFVQTTGGRAGMPAPRRVSHPPFVQVVSPTVWTTFALEIDAAGSAKVELVGASSFPRHWVFGPDGALAAKSALTDVEHWYRGEFGTHSPWGEEDSPALVAEVESALERQMSATIMQGARPEVRQLRPGDLLTEQGEEGGPLFLILDGMLSVEKDGETVGEVGPGAVVGERAYLEEGMRTATMRARTPVRVAVAEPELIDRPALEQLCSWRTRRGVIGGHLPGVSNWSTGAWSSVRTSASAMKSTSSSPVSTLRSRSSKAAGGDDLVGRDRVIAPHHEEIAPAAEALGERQHRHVVEDGCEGGGLGSGGRPSPNRR